MAAARPEWQVADDGLRWSAVIERYLPPRHLWPDLAYERAGLEYPGTLNLADQLLNGARAAPDSPAIIFHNETISYGALRRRVLDLSAALLRMGLRPADRVAFRLPNGPDFVVSWLAVQWIGAIAVPIAPVCRRREIGHIANHSGAVAILTTAESMAEVQAAGQALEPRVAVMVVPDEGRDPLRRGERGIPNDDTPAGDSTSPAAYPTDRDHPAVITYRTDADGTPKGVVHSPANILAAADTYARNVLMLTSADVCIGTMSLAWAYGLGALLTFPLRVGAAAAFPDTGSTALLETIASSRATVFFGVPTTYRMLLRRPDLDSFEWRSLRCCVSAAEPLPAEVAERWRARTGVEIVDGLGTTELTHIVVSARPGATRPGLIGTPVAGYEVRIVDDAFHELPRGVPGRLAVRGPTGARYWRDSDAQRQAVRSGWTLTADICIQHADGWLQHVRRTDDLIVSAGHKISAREVERVLEDHPSVSHARVVAASDPVRGAVAIAVVIPADGVDRARLPEQLQGYLNGELAAFKCPRDFRIVQR